MISIDEIIKGQEVPEAYLKDLKTLLDRINKVRQAYGKPMNVTSGYRSYHDHERIYKEKAAKRGIPFYSSQVPKASKHLYCQALDIADPNKELQKWCLDNVALLESIGLWMEDFSATSNWVHFQILPPASGKRFFLP